MYKKRYDLFSTFISHIWDYILERNYRQCVNMSYPWSSFSVHMVFLLPSLFCYYLPLKEDVVPHFILD